MSKDKRKHLGTIFVLVGLLFNHLVTLMPLGEIYQSYVKDALFNFVKLFAYGYAGWLIVYSYDRSLTVATISGAVVYFIDHVILRLIYLAVVFWDSETVGVSNFRQSLYQLLELYVLSFPVPMLISVIGGYIAKRTKRQEKNKIPN